MLIDINCDLGEGIGNDAAIMPLISSCNIACGAHAGTTGIIDQTIALAIKHHVKIGAHPSFPDKENFGRKPMKMTKKELENTVFGQILTLKNRTYLQAAVLHHIKPHGALYNEACIKSEMAEPIVKALKRLNKNLVLYAPYRSVLADVAINAGITVHYEAFIDRRYNSDLSLVSRKLQNATLSNKEEVCEQLLTMVTKNKILSIQGAVTTIKAETFCIHGDNKNVLAILNHIHQKCVDYKIKIA